MRHRKIRRKLNRTTSERTALMRSLVSALLLRQRITTTVAKAKEARRLAEKTITLAKKGGLACQRRLFSILLDRDLVKELVSEIAPRFKNRHGGYTRIIRLSKYRKGDNAEMVILELTEQKIIEAPVKKAKKIEKEKTKAPAEETKADHGAPGEKPPQKEELPKHPPKETKKHHIEKPKKGGFFQNIQKFLKPKTGTG